MAASEGQSNSGNQSDPIREFVSMLAGFMQQQVVSKEAQAAAQEESLQKQAAAMKAMSEEIQKLQEGFLRTPLQESTSALVSEVPMNPFPVSHEDNRGTQQFRQFSELRTPHFSGTQNPVEAETWLERVVKDLTTIGCDIQYWVSFATFLLESEAALWWSSVLSQMEEPIVWDDFVKEFDDKYFPSWYKKKKEMEFWFLMQGSMTVIQYEAKFTALFRFASHEFGEEDEKVTKFEAGLKEVIKRKVRLFCCNTYKEIVKKAMIIEEGELDNSNTQTAPLREKMATHQTITLGKRKAGESSRSNSKIFCHRCGVAGHLPRNCPRHKKQKLDQHITGRHITTTSSYQHNVTSRPSPRPISVSEEDSTRSSNTCCYRCGETGHFAWGCSRRPREKLGQPFDARTVTTASPFQDSAPPSTQLPSPHFVSEEDVASSGKSHCFRCQEIGHLAWNFSLKTEKLDQHVNGSTGISPFQDPAPCPSTQLQTPVTVSEEDFTSVSKFDCYQCLKVGHLARNCPHRNKKDLDQPVDARSITTTCSPHPVASWPPTQLPVRPVRLVSWRGPHPGVIRLNVDGCSRGNPGPSAAGGVFRDHRGTILAAFGCFLGHHNNSYAELVAVLEGLTYVSQLGFSNVEVESDSTEVVDWVTGSNEGRYGFAYIVRSIRQLTNKYNIKIKHVLREANQAADFMANWACTTQVIRLFTCSDELPPGLIDIARFDSMELPCLRQ